MRLPKIFLTFEKGLVELDDSYVAKRGCPLFPLLPHVAQNQSSCATEMSTALALKMHKDFVLRKRSKSRLRLKTAKKEMLCCLLSTHHQLSYHHNIMHPLTETTYHSPTTAKNEQP